MKPIPAAVLLAAPLFVGLSAPSLARDRDDVPAAVSTGPARDCVPVRRLGSSEVRNDRVIDFMTSRRDGYRVTLSDACPGLGFERAFTYRTPLSQLCEQDYITVLRNAGGRLERGSSCTLARFEPIRLAERR